MKSELKIPKTIVLVGMMGVGKTSIGKRLSRVLGMPFRDSDHEVEKAAGCSVSDIYEIYGVDAFMDVEKRVIKRVMDQKPHVLSTGVGAFIDLESRALIKEKGFSIWLDASISTILPRVSRRDHRPQLEQSKTDKKMILQQYIHAYTPAYQEADIKVDCDNQLLDKTVDMIVQELKKIF